MLKMKYKLLSALVIAAPLLVNTGIVTTVHAASCTNSTQTVISKVSCYSSVDFKTKLDTLVAEGVITQDQEIAILNLYYDGEITTISNFKTHLDTLVTVGTITTNHKISILNLFNNWGSNWQLSAPPNGYRHNSSVSDKSKTNYSMSDKSKNSKSSYDKSKTNCSTSDKSKNNKSTSDKSKNNCLTSDKSKTNRSK
ncbi:hypothetical protein ACJDU8_21105 [Clostridium sp. WILCCON 0269]|uniref:DUF2680 domain-containing protein n=1 Tax=Candidatus Clostridium eludens TaxID=3381663 RepID=A0ABW8SQH0_9CLOT